MPLATQVKIREACLLRDAREKSSAKQEVPCSSVRLRRVRAVRRAMSIMFRKCASSSTKPALHSRQAGMVIRGTVERGLEDGYSARGTTWSLVAAPPSAQQAQRMWRRACFIIVQRV